jgi:TolB-like protein/class 3 adenylate cyclase/Tfp pilus assembly protein PilF
MTGETLTTTRPERRLAAVLAADVVGYCRLMGADEMGTLAALKANRREVVDPAIAEHNGRIVKTSGDGMLVEFASAVDAVNCAVNVQAMMADRNTGAAAKIAFRIGINIGDIIIDGDDIFGDDVNIAARIENECAPGGVYLTDDAFRQVRGKTQFIFDDVGERMLKNIERPVRIYAVRAADGTAAPPTAGSENVRPSRLSLPDKPSIAVLPFQNMSGDPEQEYFADGMVEDIITALSHFKSLFVIARNSSFTYKGKTVGMKQIGRELGVRYVLEGSVRKAGNRVRISGQLVDAESGAHLWADRFDGDLDDIFDLQDSITSSVVGAIAPRVQKQEFERIKRKPTENLSAYDYYLRGLAKFHQFKKEPLEEARSLYRKAIELDPDFASPYAADAFCVATRQTFGWGLVDAVETAELVSFARRAAELDKDDALVLTYAGFGLALVAHDLETGAAFLERAVAANANLAIAWTYRGWVNVQLGNHRDAIDFLKRALRLSPLDPLEFATMNGLAAAYLLSGQHAEAIAWAARTLRSNPEWAAAYRIGMACYAHFGDIETAKSLCRTAQRLDPTQRLSTMRQRMSCREADLLKLIEGYRLAGMPE